MRVLTCLVDASLQVFTRLRDHVVRFSFLCALKVLSFGMILVAAVLCGVFFYVP